MRWGIRIGMLLLCPMVILAQSNRSGWRVEESKSEMTDELLVVIRLSATAGVPGQLGTVVPTLMLRCKERELEAYVSFQMVLDGGLYDNSPVRLRWNEDRPEEVVNWSRSSDFQAVFAPDAAGFIARLARARRLRVEARPHDRGEVVANFSPRGLEPLTVKLVKACPGAGLDSALAGNRAPRYADVTKRTAAVPDTGAATPAYFDFQVEKQVAPRPGNVGPRYPDMLLSARVEGEVLVQFVVDTAGMPEMESFKILISSHDLFSGAVREAVAAMKFYPAEIGGRKVRQLMQQPFNFTLAR